MHVRLSCGSLSITTPVHVSLLANEFDVRSVLHGQVSLVAVNQICVIHESFENVDIYEYTIETNIILRTCLGISHAHHSCVEKRGKFVWVPSFQLFTNSDQYRFQIRLCQMDISAFSGKSKVTKMCPKYLLTRYYKWNTDTFVNRSCEIKQYTKFPSLFRVCEYEGSSVQYTRLIWTAQDLTSWPSG